MVIHLCYTLLQNRKIRRLNCNKVLEFGTPNHIINDIYFFEVIESLIIYYSNAPHPFTGIGDGSSLTTKYYCQFFLHEQDNQ